MYILKKNTKGVNRLNMTIFWKHASERCLFHGLIPWYWKIIVISFDPPQTGWNNWDFSFQKISQVYEVRTEQENKRSNYNLPKLLQSFLSFLHSKNQITGTIFCWVMNMSVRVLFIRYWREMECLQKTSDLCQNLASANSTSNLIDSPYFK